MEVEAVNRAFDRLHNFEAVQSAAVSELEDERRNEALGDAMQNMRAFIGLGDEAARAFHHRFDAFFEERSGQKPPHDYSVLGFIGFMLGLIAVEEEAQPDAQ
jgi:hypothetical protein